MAMLVKLSVAVSLVIVKGVPAFCATTVPELPLPPVKVSFGKVTNILVAEAATTVSVPESFWARPPKATLIVAVPVTRPVNTAPLRSTAGTKSPFTTPPVLVGNDQASAAAFVIKFEKASRVIAWAAIELPAAMFCARTNVPLPSGKVSTRTDAAAPATSVRSPKLLPPEPSADVVIPAIAAEPPSMLGR